MKMDVGFTEMHVQDSEKNLSFPMLLMHPNEFVGKSHRLVMLSHGSGGSPLAYRYLAEFLADKGYFVGVPEHPGNNRHDNSLEGTLANLVDRPRHLRLATDAILNDERWRESLDQNNISLIGHSMGGYTSLALAGGIPHTEHQMKYDPDHKIEKSEVVPVLADARVRALVLFTPATGWYLSEGALAAVKVPMLVLSAEHDDITPAFHAEIILKGVPDKSVVTHREVKNAGHYSFLDVFPESVRKMGLPAAMDPVGFDREAFHDELNTEVFEFLETHR